MPNNSFNARAEAALLNMLDPLMPDLMEMQMITLPAQELSYIYYAAANISQLSEEIQLKLAMPEQKEQLMKILTAADKRLLELITPDTVAEMPLTLIYRLQQLSDNAANLTPDQRERLKAALDAAQDQTQEAQELISDSAEALTDALQEASQEAQEAFNNITPTLAALDARYKAFTESHTAQAVEDILDLELFLQVELKRAAEHAPELAQYTIWDILAEGFTKTGKPRKGKFYNIILEAIQARKEYRQAATEISKPAEAAPTKQVKVIHTNNVGYPLDKPNSVLWDGLTGKKVNNQLQIATVTIDTSRGKTQKEAGIIYGISFDRLEQTAPDLTITKKLTQFDKRVYISAAAIYNAGNKYTTVTQIYRQMGNTGRPKAADLKKINDSLTKMGIARIYIDSSQEAGIYKGYKKFKYDAALLPFERAENIIINGKEVDTAIHFFREPPLMTFARQRKQITTLELELLESPISKTEANLAIDDYLLERISRIKKGTAQPRILYETLYQKCNISTKKQKQRAPEKIKRYLDHYKSKGFIDNYSEDADGITIYASKQVAAKAEKNKKTP